MQATTLRLFQGVEYNGACPRGFGALAEIAVWTGYGGTTEFNQIAAGMNTFDVGTTMQLLTYYPLQHNIMDYGPTQSPLEPSAGYAPLWGEHPPVTPARLPSSQFFAK